MNLAEGGYSKARDLHAAENMLLFAGLNLASPQELGTAPVEPLVSAGLRVTLTLNPVSQGYETGNGATEVCPDKEASSVAP